MKYYLTNSMQCVIVSGVSWKPLSFISGVPQGSVFGPLLFLIYINGITELPLLSESKLVMYADDILLYRPIRQASGYQRLQQDVEALRTWANNNYLTFNPLKSKVMVFSRKRHPVPAPSYFSLNGSDWELLTVLSTWALRSLLTYSGQKPSAPKPESFRPTVSAVL